MAFCILSSTVICDDNIVSNLISSKMSCTIGTTASTGQKCPCSGVWKVKGTPTTTAPIAKGNRMPPYGGKGVTWRLIHLA